jgi:hypothetical protein
LRCSTPSSDRRALGSWFPPKACLHRSKQKLLQNLALVCPSTSVENKSKSLVLHAYPSHLVVWTELPQNFKVTACIQIEANNQLVQIKLDNDSAIRTLKKLPGSSLSAHGRCTCTTTTRFIATSALLRSHCAPRLLVTQPHGLYVNLVVCREYSSPGHSGSTSTTPYAAATSSSGCTTTSTTISTSKLVENGFRDINY